MPRNKIPISSFKMSCLCLLKHINGCKPLKVDEISPFAAEAYFFSSL